MASQNHYKSIHTAILTIQHYQNILFNKTIVITLNIFSWETFKLFRSRLWATLCIYIHTLRLRQNGRHFADDIFKCIFLNENIWISINISLNFVPKGQINNIPLSEPMMVSLLTRVCVARPQWVNINETRTSATAGLTSLFARNFIAFIREFVVPIPGK